MIRRLALVATLALSFAPLAVTAAIPGGDCETWAADYNYPRQSVRMAQIGCVESSPRVYVNRPGICNQVARQAARNGYMGGAAVQYVERKVPTCYWDAGAVTYGIRSTTQKAG